MVNEDGDEQQLLQLTEEEDAIAKDRHSLQVSSVYAAKYKLIKFEPLTGRNTLYDPITLSPLQK